MTKTLLSFIGQPPIIKEETQTIGLKEKGEGFIRTRRRWEDMWWNILARLTLRKTMQEILINMIPQVLGVVENNYILGNIMEEEVKCAMFSMKAYKAPGLDGFPLTFFFLNLNWFGLPKTSLK